MTALELGRRSRRCPAGSRLVAAGNHGHERIPGKHGAPPTVYAALTVLLPDAPGQLARLFADIGEVGINVEELAWSTPPASSSLAGVCARRHALRSALTQAAVWTDAARSDRPDGGLGTNQEPAGYLATVACLMQTTREVLVPDAPSAPADCPCRASPRPRPSPSPWTVPRDPANRSVPAEWRAGSGLSTSTPGRCTARSPGPACGTASTRPTRPPSAAAGRRPAPRGRHRPGRPVRPGRRVRRRAARSASPGHHGGSAVRAVPAVRARAVARQRELIGRRTRRWPRAATSARGRPGRRGEGPPDRPRRRYAPAVRRALDGTGEPSRRRSRGRRARRRTRWTPPRQPATPRPTTRWRSTARRSTSDEVVEAVLAVAARRRLSRSDRGRPPRGAVAAAGPRVPSPPGPGWSGGAAGRLAGLPGRPGCTWPAASTCRPPARARRRQPQAFLDGPLVFRLRAAAARLPGQGGDVRAGRLGGRCRPIGQIPVDREGPDRSALRQALAESAPPAVRSGSSRRAPAGPVTLAAVKRRHRSSRRWFWRAVVPVACLGTGGRAARGARWPPAGPGGGRLRRPVSAQIEGDRRARGRPPRQPRSRCGCGLRAHLVEAWRNHAGGAAERAVAPSLDRST